MLFRCKADPSYVLGVRSDSCVQGGWVGLLHRSSPAILHSWEISDGMVRPKANPRYALCLNDQSCQNGGWVQLSESASVLGQWVISGNCLRAKGNPGFVLCARRDFQGIHMWSFDGLPDVYGQWDLDESPQGIRCSRLGSSVGLLRPVISKLREALMLNDPEGEPGKSVLDMQSQQFVEAMQSLILVMEQLGWRAGALLETDNEKLSRLHRKAGRPGYRSWLLSETAVHQETGYQEYADDSVTMANLWIARNLRFLSELFFLLADTETSDSVNIAYSRTLQAHHSFLERQAFFLVYGQLPAREQLLKILEGEVEQGTEVIIQEMLEMAELSHQVVDFCLRLDEEMSEKISAEKAQFEVDAAYGKARAGSGF